MTGLSREAIFGAMDVETRPVEVPEWGGTVYVRTMSGLDRDEFESTAAQLRASGDLKRLSRALMVASVACDEAGVRLFTLDDLETLAAKNGLALGRIAQAGIALNKLDEEEVETQAKKS